MRSQSVQILAQHRLLYLKTHFARESGSGLYTLRHRTASAPSSLPARPANASADIERGHHQLLGAKVMRTHPLVTIVMGSFELILLLYLASTINGIFRGNGEKVPLILLIGTALYFLLISGGAL